MPLRYKLTLLSLISLCTLTIIYGQSEYIDRSFGDNGTISFDNDTLEYYNLLGLDSLDNMYISHLQWDKVSNIYHYKLIKLDKKGVIIENNILINPDDSISAITINNNKLILYKFISNSTINETYDLDYNYLGRIIIPYITYFPNATKSGGIEGQINNTFFKYKADGLLDKSFSEDGLYNINENNDLSEVAGILAYSRTKDQSILLAGYEQDPIDSLYYPITIKLNADGSLDNNYGYAGTAIHNIRFENHYISYPNSIEQLQDDNFLMYGVHYDTLYNFRYFLAKIDKDGELDLSFGDNAILSVFPQSGDSTTLNDRYRYIGEFSNGSLLSLSIIKNEADSITAEYLSLFNENGIKEVDFGIDSKIDLNAFKGQDPTSQYLANDNLYIINRDTIQSRPSANRITSIITATHITKLNTTKLLAYEPQSPPQTSNFMLFPNPVTSNTSVEYNGPTLENFSYRIHDLNGQLIKEKVLPILYNYGQIPIDMKDTATGLYYLQILNEGKEIWSTKFVKIN